MPTAQNTSPLNKENRQENQSRQKGNFPRLTEPDLDFDEVKVEDIIYKLHSEYELTKSRANEEISKRFTIH
ncbi:MAG: hypothetical protein ABSG15_09745 [FCB group bacterium]|jgi:hypothetical protein